MARKPLRNTSAFAPIQPIPPTPTTPSNNANVERLEHEKRGLQILLAAERRRHAKLEAAVAKYIALLENTCSELRSAYLTKGAKLAPAQECR
jgi:hypothetical protein